MQNQIALIIPAPSLALEGHYKNLTQIKQDVLAQYMEWERKIGKIAGWHLDRLRFSNFTAQHLSFVSSSLKKTSDCVSF